jgi:hypothetical protein
MAAWASWAGLARRLKEQCSSCRDSSSAKSSRNELAGAAIDAARVADTPLSEADGSRGRQGRQFNPQREAALKPGMARGSLHLQQLAMAMSCTAF